MAAAPSCTWVDCPAVWGWTMISGRGPSLVRNFQYLTVPQFRPVPMIFSNTFLKLKLKL